MLAPYYDSASCLGRNEPDAKRLRRLHTRDSGDTVDAYAARARSAFVSTPGGPERLTPVEAFARAAVLRPRAALAWLGRLAEVREPTVVALLARIPPDRMSDPARGFAGQMLHYNRDRLLALRADVEAAAARPEETR